MLPSQLLKGQALTVTRTKEGETGLAIVFTNDGTSREVFAVPHPAPVNPTEAEEAAHHNRSFTLPVPTKQQDAFFQELLLHDGATVE